MTAFEKKRSSATDNTTDTADTPKGKRNDTATPQNTASDYNDSEKSADGKSFYSALNSMSHDEIGRKLFDMVTSGRQIFNADKAYADNMASIVRSEPLTQKNKKSAPETVLPEETSSFKGTVVSSTDGANILKNPMTINCRKMKYLARRRKTF